MKAKPKFRIPTWFPELETSTVEKLSAYQQELLKFNNTINLISPRTIEDADLLHFADAIIGAQIVFKHNTSDEIYDIGSGNGFPGLVMAILSPEIKFVLVDSDRRKAEFLKHTAATLNLQNVLIRPGRLESLPADSIKTGVCRAFSHLPRALLISRHAFAKGAKFFQFKGSEWAFEMAQLPEQICSTWNTIFLEEYELPEQGVVHSILQASKIK